mgnify:CR=1 FL=1
MKAYFKRVFLLGGVYLLTLVLSCLFNGWIFALVLYIITAVFIISLIRLLFNNVPNFLRCLQEKKSGVDCLSDGNRLVSLFGTVVIGFGIFRGRGSR